MAAPSSPFDRPIALVGMPGAGKTSVGRRLARRLGLGFRDSDEEVEREAGRTIDQLFASDGEAAFRQRERQAIADLVDTGPLVIATGGGAMVQPETRRLLLNRTTTIWLKASAQTLSVRLANQPPRPLLGSGALLARLLELQDARKPIYARADIHLQTDGLDLPGVVEVASEALADWSPGRA